MTSSPDAGSGASGSAPWRLLTVEAAPGDEEDLSSALCRMGALGVQRLPAEGVGEDGAITLMAWFDVSRPLPGLEDLRRVCPGSQALRILSVSDVEDGRWVERWIEGLGPIDVGRGLRILPVPDDEDLEPASPAAPPGGGRLTVRIVPGRAFGTGEHATTRLCLEAIETQGVRDASVLDVGTGSGILAIAASALGCRRAVGIDLDGEALRVARRNVRLNAAWEKVLLAQGETASVGAAFDCVMANLNAGLLEDLGVDLLARVRPGGTLILSGMLEGEERRVAGILARAGAAETAAQVREGWACTVHRVARA